MSSSSSDPPHFYRASSMGVASSTPSGGACTCRGRAPGPPVSIPLVWPVLPFQQPYHHRGCPPEATYAQWHRRLEAMQHAVQSQVYRYRSGFGE